MLDKNIAYRGYQTHDPHEAYKLYLENTGLIPLSIVIRPDFMVTSEHPLLIRSRLGAYGIILVTHEISTRMSDDNGSVANEEVEELMIDEFVEVINNQINGAGNNGNKAKAVSQKHAVSICPHCQQKLSGDKFNNLGYWHGWKLGKEPPYWGALRNYVFRRDKYTCSKCKVVFKPIDLRCHHVVSKESGGVDGARNLTTMCGACHPDDKPIFEDN